MSMSIVTIVTRGDLIKKHTLYFLQNVFMFTLLLKTEGVVIFSQTLEKVRRQLLFYQGFG
jgi:hypothetical protein